MSLALRRRPKPSDLGTLDQWCCPARLDGQWSNAARTTPATNGGGVYTSDDLSGNGRHWVQATGANQGVLTFDKRVGKPALVCGATFSMLSSAYTTGTPAFVVVVAASTVGTYNAYMIDSGVADNKLALAWSDATHMFGYSGGTYTPTAVVCAQGTPTVYHAYFHATAGQGQVGHNGTEVQVDMGNAANVNGTRLGVNGNAPTSGSFYSGPMTLYEVLVYSGSAITTAAGRKAIVNMEMAAWNI